MIDIRFFYDDAHAFAIVGIEAKGHAGFAVLGKDVVCAAASVLLQTLWLGLTEVTSIAVDGGWSSGDLHLTWSAQDASRSDVAALTQTAKRALTALAAQYPRNLRVRE